LHLASSARPPHRLHLNLEPQLRQHPTLFIQRMFMRAGVCTRSIVGSPTFLPIAQYRALPAAGHVSSVTVRA
jgi:hypothetical protein